MFLILYAWYSDPQYRFFKPNRNIKSCYQPVIWLSKLGVKKFGIEIEFISIAIDIQYSIKLSGIWLSSTSKELFSVFKS